MKSSPFAGVTNLEPGAHVIGVGVGGGAFAEYMVLPAAAAVSVPAGWADEQALGLVVSWPTALAALKPLGCIAAGQIVLIHAAAGGTGQIHLIGLNIGILIQAAPQIFGELMREMFGLLAAGVLRPGACARYPCVGNQAQVLRAVQ